MALNILFFIITSIAAYPIDLDAKLNTTISTDDNNSTSEVITSMFSNPITNGDEKETLSETLIPIESDSEVVVISNREESENMDPGGFTEIRISFENKQRKEGEDSKTEADIILAEQVREIAISAKNFDKGDDTSNILNFKNIADSNLGRQFNISRAVIDHLVDAETERDDSMTDMFKISDPDLAKDRGLEGYSADVPHFDFLVGEAPKNPVGQITETVDVRDSDNLKKNNNQNNFSDNESGRRNNSDDMLMKSEDYVELIEVVGPTKSLDRNKSSYNTYGNITGFYVENDGPDTILSLFSAFSDLQTVLVTSVATILPLLLVLAAAFVVRCMCKRYCPRCCSKSEQSSHDQDSLASSEDEKPTPENNHQYKSELTMDASAESAPRAEPGATPQPAANGSIITMTLKNNHLIVETEERNDIIKDGRETKMKYSPESDGIFVVEVQQSAPYRSANKPNSPQLTPISSNQKALIHKPPEGIVCHDQDNTESSSKMANTYGKNNETSKSQALSNTGLSISDLSISSVGSHNPSYSYSSQTGYEQGLYGYPIYAGYDVPSMTSLNEGFSQENSREPLLSKTPTDPDKPVVTAAIFKQDSIIGNDALAGPGYCIEGSTDGPLLSDVQAREVSLHQLQDKIDKKSDTEVSPKVVNPNEAVKKSPANFQRSDTLPPRLPDEYFNAPADNVGNNPAPPDHKVFETIDEDGIQAEIEHNVMMKGKRASLPIITTEVYETIKESAKTVFPNSSPKFEKLSNEVSPVEGGNNSGSVTPLITVTEEVEVQGLQGEDVTSEC